MPHNSRLRVSHKTRYMRRRFPTAHIRIKNARVEWYYYTINTNARWQGKSYTQLSVPSALPSPVNIIFHCVPTLQRMLLSHTFFKLINNNKSLNNLVTAIYTNTNIWWFYNIFTTLLHYFWYVIIICILYYYTVWYKIL